MAINYDQGLFAIDNVAQGFSLYTLEDMQFLREYLTGKPTKRFPKQVEFGEDSRVLVGGSDHGTIYVFDRKLHSWWKPFNMKMMVYHKH